ncbi:hypothetical protein XENOCAPTIV_023552, partial [Xenoophorus captivus]
SPENSTMRSPFDSDLQPCDAKALLDNEAEPVKTVLEGVDVQRGYGLVKTEDGRQAELATVAVDAWHIKEHGEEELPEGSLGHLHEGDAYVIRWKYSITTLDGWRLFCVRGEAVVEASLVEVACELAICPAGYSYGFLFLRYPGKYNYTPRLFWLSASSGVFEGEEQLYPARVTEGVMAMPFLQENLYSAQQPGFEPLTFTNIFPSWEKNTSITSKVTNTTSSSSASFISECFIIKVCIQAGSSKNKVILVKDALSKLSKQQFSIEELTKKPLPEGVDPLRLEDYLSDQDFKVAHSKWS